MPEIAGTSLIDDLGLVFRLFAAARFLPGFGEALEAAQWTTDTRHSIQRRICLITASLSCWTPPLIANASSPVVIELKILIWNSNNKRSFQRFGRRFKECRLSEGECELRLYHGGLGWAL